MCREEWLRERIEAQYKTLFYFSKQIQMPHSTLRRILSPGGINTASFENIVRICQSLGISIDELMAQKTDRKDLPLLVIDAHEKAVIEAYRKNTSLQPVVDRVLEV